MLKSGIPECRGLIANPDAECLVLPPRGKRNTGYFDRPDQVVQLGLPPVRVDLITSLTGVSWEEAWTGRVAAHYGDIPVQYIGRDEFVANKRSTGRSKDMVDLEALGSA
jgi:hypothetical protein